MNIKLGFVVWGFCSLASHSFASSVSEQYAYLANDNEARMLFTQGQMDKLKSLLETSPNFQSVAQLFKPLFDGQRTRKSLKRDTHHTLNWIDNGIEKPSQIELVDLTQSVPNQEIFSNYQDGIGVANIITDFSLSPDAKYIEVLSSEYGSIDQMECSIVEIDTRKLVQTFHLTSNLRAWTGAHRFMYNKLNDDGTSGFAEFDFDHNIENPYNSAVPGSNQDLVLLENYSEKVNWYSIEDKTTGNVVNFDWPEEISPQLIGNDQDNAYFLTYDNGEKASEILKASRHPQGQVNPKVVTPEKIAQVSELFLEKAWFDTDTIFAQMRSGPDRWLRLYSTTGQQTAQIAIPDCCSVTNVAWDQRQHSVKVTLASPLFSMSVFSFRLDTFTWDQDPSVQMLNDRDLHLVSEVVYSKSEDGTKIPSRLVHLKDLTQNSSHPVEIQSYGGFAVAGYCDPSFDPTVLEFIKRGGIFVGTGIRGGNEYGPDWHKQAILNNKIKTYQDLASVADFLVSAKWTRPSLIVSRGTSNGGLTVAATALLFPTKFGLAIPIAGVDDLLGKDLLDTVNDGWSDEYGSDEAASDFLRTISPVENSAHIGSVYYLIIDGASDTRVNPVHSVKLAKALEDLGKTDPSQVQLLTMQNAGHWLESVSYQNTIGLQTETVIWTQIYDLAKINVGPTHFARDFDPR